MLLKENENLEPLGGTVKVIVSDVHKFWTDTVILANFSQPKKYEKAVDLGSGCGTIPLLWNRDNSTNHTVAVEIQEDACDMLRRSVELNNLQNKITVLHEDLKNLKGKLDFGVYDLVVCNPPYKAIGTGIVNTIGQKRTARHEETCTIKDITDMAAKLLKFSGRFCLCLRPERLCDVIESMRASDIEPKRLRFVQQRLNKAPKLFLIEGKKGAKPSGLVTMPALIIEDEFGNNSEEMMKIYGSYKDDVQYR